MSGQHGLAGRELPDVSADPWIEDLRYSIEVFSERGGSVEVLGRLRDLAAARAAFEACQKKYPKRLILLCQGGRVLSRSDDDEDEVPTR
jgi:hypothetical protein